MVEKESKEYFMTHGKYTQFTFQDPERKFYGFTATLICFEYCLWLHGFPGGTSGKESACQCRRHRRCMINPWVGKIPWRRVWQPTPVLLPGESNGQRSLTGYIPEGRKESTWLKQFSTYTRTFMLQWWAECSAIVPINLKIFSLCSFTKKVCDPCVGERNRGWGIRMR